MDEKKHWLTRLVSSHMLHCFCPPRQSLAVPDTACLQPERHPTACGRPACPRWPIAGRSQIGGVSVVRHSLIRWAQIQRRVAGGGGWRDRGSYPVAEAVPPRCRGLAPDAMSTRVAAAVRLSRTRQVNNFRGCPPTLVAPCSSVVRQVRPNKEGV